MVRPAEPSRPDIASRRARWQARQVRIDLRRRVFDDETWIRAKMAPLRGWGLRGRRLDARVPYGYREALTFIAALRHNRLEAPCLVEGSVSTELFTAISTPVPIPR